MDVGDRLPEWLGGFPLYIRPQRILVVPHLVTLHDQGGEHDEHPNVRAPQRNRRGKQDAGKKDDPSGKGDI